MIFDEWGIFAWLEPVKLLFVLVLIALLTVRVQTSRKAFVAVAAGLSIALATTDPAWMGAVKTGLGSAAFIGAFFAALSTLRNVAGTSPAIQRAGAFLTGQRPGHRYAALTVGGQAFALLLNYGALQLLGTLAMSNAESENNPEVRGHRIRRMLLAIQRGFVSTLPWSPLSFAMVVSTSVIPETSWAENLLAGLVTSLILAGVGWALDTAFKPRVAVASVPVPPSGTWVVMVPLVTLLAALVAGVVVLNQITDVRIVGLVAVLVPAIALVWMLIQHWADAPLSNVARRVHTYVLHELPSYRGELILLMMAGYIGTVGARLLGPQLLGAGLNFSAVPPWIILASLVWIIPLAGQIGMNPILAVTLIAPLIPDVASLGVEPTALVVTLIAGWTISGASSPFTATTLLIGSFAGVSARHVGVVWNGLYSLVCSCALTAWVLIYAFVL
ncbi:hypothetical protein [Marinovum sp.]|uniref:hypothetical protein n=1 Tax=Marinovum sp. TaxID=2024839 RepID=UPI002B26A00D|nr:hypothetical protein [Marinovum sp.]